MTSVLLYSGLSILLFLVTGDYIYSVSVYGDQFCFVLASEISIFFSSRRTVLRWFGSWGPDLLYLGF